MASQRRFVRLTHHIINLDAIAYLTILPDTQATEHVRTEVVFLVAMHQDDDYLSLTLNEADTDTLLAALDADERDAHAPLLAEYARLRYRSHEAEQRFARMERMAAHEADRGFHLSPDEQSAYTRADEDRLAAGHALAAFETNHPDVVVLAREGEDR